MTFRTFSVAFLTLFIIAPSSASPPAPKGGGVPSVLADIGPSPRLTLTDQHGRPFDLTSLRGKAVLVSFVYTTCNGTCPATTTSLCRVRQALRDAKLWGDRVEFVSVTLDPARDSSETLLDYARVYGADRDHWHFLTGHEAAVARVHRDWGLWTRVLPTGALDHPSRVFLIDPAGHEREIYSLDFLAPEAVVKDVRTVLADPVGER